MVNSGDNLTVLHLEERVTDGLSNADKKAMVTDQ